MRGPINWPVLAGIVIVVVAMVLTCCGVLVMFAPGPAGPQ